MAVTLRTISYRPAGNGGYTVLADETAVPSAIIKGFAPRMRAVLQIEPTYGAANISVFDRGNREFTLQFQVDRMHADAEAAADFMNTHMAALPNLVDVKIVQGAKTNYLVTAGLEMWFDEPCGRSTTAHYQFTAQNYTDTAP